MKASLALLVSLHAFHGIDAWTPQTFQRELAKGCATAATCAALLGAPLASQAADPTSFDINVNVPYVVDLVKSPEARTKTIDWVQYIAESIENLVGPAVSVELPTDYKAVARQALSGGASIKLNGQEVDVKVISSTKGNIQLQISNPLLPALPFAGLPTTPKVLTQTEYAVADATPAVIDAVSKELAGANGQPFWEQPIGSLRVDFGPFHKAVTPIDVVGVGSLALGGAYGLSYGYYSYSNYKATKATEDKKRKAAAAKKAKAAATDEAVVTISAPESATVEIPNLETGMTAIESDNKPVESKPRKRDLFAKLMGSGAN